MYMLYTTPIDSIYVCIMEYLYLYKYDESTHTYSESERGSISSSINCCPQIHDRFVLRLSGARVTHVVVSPPIFVGIFD